MTNPFDLYWYVTVNTSELLKLKLTAAGFFFVVLQIIWF